MQLILASGSPQRKMLLEGLGVRFEIVVPDDVDESGHDEMDPIKRALELAQLKALSVAKQRSGVWVVGCDTLVVSPEGHLFEKPADAAEARRMIETQSGRTSTVHSGLCLVSPDFKLFEGVSSSQVLFKKLSPAEVEWWVSGGLWKGRSGAFQIDGLGQLMIESITGDWSSVVGFPVFLFGELCVKAGVTFLQ